MPASTLLSRLIDRSYSPPLALLRGAAAALLYPVAERLERREVRDKLSRLRAYYRLPADEQTAVARQRLGEILRFAASEVPYYRDVFATTGLDPDKVAADPRRLAELPLLTKDIISEQGERLLSRPLAEIRHHACATGGSTGRKVVIYYDQQAADHSSAVTTYARERIGATRWRTTLHFAAALPDTPPERWPNRETYKGIAMNRSNVFFSRLDAEGMDAALGILTRRSPWLVHGHPSTLHAIARHAAEQGRTWPPHKPLFAIFESSGELLDARQRQAIAASFGCRVVDRYGLAELGVVAYQFDPGQPELDLLQSECWAENVPADDDPAAQRLVITGFRNRLMPLIRYDTGDLAAVRESSGRTVLETIAGRIHDRVPISGVPHLTHYLQDVLDHRIGGIEEFQFDLRSTPPTLRIALGSEADRQRVTDRIEGYWPGAFRLDFVRPDAMVRVGRHGKFRHVVTA